jgi:hypothetical protein
MDLYIIPKPFLYKSLKSNPNTIKGTVLFSNDGESVKSNTDKFISNFFNKYITIDPLQKKSREISDSFVNSLQAYHNGSITDDEFSDIFKNTFEQLKKINAENGSYDGSAEDDVNILIGLFDRSLYFNHAHALNKNYTEGKGVASEYGDEKDQDWIYYNSKNFHIHEKIKNLLESITKNIAASIGYENLDISEIKNDGRYDFNRQWSHMAQFSARNGAMYDISKVPPEDFVFFYKETANEKSADIQISTKNMNSITQKAHSAYSIFDYIKPSGGILLVKSGGHTYKSSVDFSDRLFKNQYDNAENFINGENIDFVSNFRINSGIKGVDFMSRDYQLRG